MYHFLSLYASYPCANESQGEGVGEDLDGSLFLDLPKGQEGQLELNSGCLSFDIFIREPEIDSGCIDVPMSQLLLEGIQAAPVVKKVDGIAMPEQMGVDSPLQVGLWCSLLDDLVTG